MDLGNWTEPRDPWSRAKLQCNKKNRLSLSDQKATMTAQHTLHPVSGSTMPPRRSWKQGRWRLLIRNDVEHDCRVGVSGAGCMDASPLYLSARAPFGTTGLAARAILSLGNTSMRKIVLRDNRQSTYSLEFWGSACSHKSRWSPCKKPLAWPVIKKGGSGRSWPSRCGTLGKTPTRCLRCWPECVWTV